VKRDAVVKSLITVVIALLHIYKSIRNCFTDDMAGKYTGMFNTDMKSARITTANRAGDR
jgi:hypothetical protein